MYASISYDVIAEIPSVGAQSPLELLNNAYYGLAAYKTGVLYAASGNGIYRFAQGGSGTVVQSVFAGGTQGSANGTGTNAQFSAPQGVTADASGKVYVADTGNNLIRIILPSGDVGLLAGAGNASAGSSDGSGTDARFNRPTGVRWTPPAIYTLRMRETIRFAPSHRRGSSTHCRHGWKRRHE